MVIAVDVGTSSARAGLFDEHGRPVPGRFHRVAYTARLTADGGAEHDPTEVVEAVAACLDAVQVRTAAMDVAAVSVTTYWHGLLGFDKDNRPVTPIYLWADTRSAAEATILASALDATALHARTGCHVHPCYWPAKLRWLARTRPAATAAVARWGSVGELLELAFTGAARTSVSIASGTGLLDQARADWDPEALAAAGIDAGQLFPLVDRTAAHRGLRPRWSSRWPGLRSAQWLPAVGDGAASNVGSGCVDPTRIALNVGTSAALRVITDSPPVPPRGLWRYRLDRRRSVVGGATSEGGNVFAWCRAQLKLPADTEIEHALGTWGAADLIALPFLAGERSPGWRAERRGALVGLSVDTTALDVLRAMLAGVALRLALVYDLLAPCAAPDHAVVASGGAFEHSRAWTQMIADALGRPILRLAEAEATSRGAAILALEALGRIGHPGALGVPPGDVVSPDPARHARAREALARQQALDERL
jgi:gluconokinase